MKTNSMKNIFYLCAVSIALLSSSLNAQWVQMSNGIGVSTGVYALAYSGNNIFAGTQSGVYLSTDSGTSWTQTLLNNLNVYSLAVNGNNVFAGTQNDYGLYLSTNSGATWAQTSLNHRFVFSLLIDGNNIYAGTEYNNIPMGVYLSTDNGTNWTQTSLNNQTVRSLAVSGNNIFAGTISNGVYLSTNNGTTWTQTSLNNQTIHTITISGNNIFAGTLVTGVYLSTNNGTTWTQTSLNNQTVYTIAVNGNNIFAGTYQYGVFASNDNGTNWMGRSEGFPNGTIVYSLCISNGYIFTGTNGAGSLYRRPLDELTNVQTILNEVPQQFSLAQNYPNPFNPSTIINFSVPSSEFVTLKVFDALGNAVATLVNKEESAGSYAVTFNASQLSSGIYFYKLKAGSFIETKKMILLK